MVKIGVGWLSARSALRATICVITHLSTSLKVFEIFFSLFIRFDSEFFNLWECIVLEIMPLDFGLLLIVPLN